jgi:hydroxyethylthiazole kinase
VTHADRAWRDLQAVRKQSPLIHNITNFVAMDVVANALLALGASPAMVHAEEEVEDFQEIASALVVNIGTLSPGWVCAMEKAAARAAELGKPWVLDPVGVGATRYRARAAAELARGRPTVIRANASEALALAGAAAAPTRGVDSSHAAEDALDAAREMARVLGSVVAVTGVVDHVTDGTRLLRVEGGHPMMTRVTALGCAASAVIGAFLAVDDDPLEAAAAALAVFGLAGARAAARSAGPGSLRIALIDELHALDERAVRDGVGIR